MLNNVSWLKSSSSEQGFLIFLAPHSYLFGEAVHQNVSGLTVLEVTRKYGCFFCVFVLV